MLAVKNPSDNMILVAGPCQIESRDHCFRIAEVLVNIVSDLPINFVFKASYDKANRTSHTSARGIGRMPGLQTLYDIRRNFQCPVTSDVHSIFEAKANYLDVVQIPALLCRQTDILQAAAGLSGSQRIVNIKKGQFMPPWNMWHAVAKVKAANPHAQVWVTERGTSFGYGDLVVDMRSLVELQDGNADRVIFDASHSCQSAIGSEFGRSGGTPEFIEPLARAALAVGVDGLFVEVHDKPDEALSDGSIAVRLDEFEGMLQRLLEVFEIGKRYRHTGAERFAAVS